MIKALVTGGNGQLAQSLKDVVNHQDELDVDFQDLPDLDITNKQQLESYFSNNELDYCINCAAYTAVDLAEEQSDLAYAVNAEGPKYLAEVCQKHQVTLIHISTDFVFDGQKRIPYLETDAPNPLSVYGASKLQGERSIQETTEAHFIVRTSWLYSEYGKNFIKTMLSLSETLYEISVVSDQIGNPTNALHLSKVIVCALMKIESSRFPSGIYHYGDKENCTWYQFAEYIFEVMFKNNQLTCPMNVKAISSCEYNSLAPRPKYSAIDSIDFCEQFDAPHFSWKEDLSETINRYLACSKKRTL